MPFRVGIDVGGTFTDAVAVDSASGEKRWAKVPTTPPGFIDGVVESVRALGIDPTAISEMAVHATTIGINAVVEGKFPPTGLICTHGFRDSSKSVAPVVRSFRTRGGTSQGRWCRGTYASV